MKDNYKNCCFCKKQLNSALEQNNADSLVTPDIEGNFGCCCNACNNKYVKPTREILWKLDKQEYNEIVPFVQQMSLAELQNALNQDNALSAFYAFKEKCLRNNRKEQAFEILSDAGCFILLILVFASIYCIPSLIQLFEFTKIAIGCFIVLIVLTSAFFVFNLVHFIRYKRNQNVDQMSRCIFNLIMFGVSALIGTIAAKLAGLF